MAAYNPAARLLHGTRVSLMRLCDTLVTPPPPPPPLLRHRIAIERHGQSRSLHAGRAAVMKVAYVRVQGRLDIGKLTTAVAELFESSWSGAALDEDDLEEQAVASETPRAFHLQAYLQWRADGGDVQITELQADRSGVRLSGSSDAVGAEYVGVLRGSTTSLAEDEQGGEFLLTGTELTPAVLQDLVEQCKAEAEPLELRTRASLSAAEVAAVQEAHKLDPLVCSLAVADRPPTPPSSPPGWRRNPIALCSHPWSQRPSLTHDRHQLKASSPLFRAKPVRGAPAQLLRTRWRGRGGCSRATGSSTECAT